MARLDSGQSDRYRDVGLTNDVHVFGGVYILPCAEDTPTDAATLAEWKPFDAVVAHAPYRLRTYGFSAKKEQTPPVLPAPQNAGAYTFLEGIYTIPHPQVQADNSFRWSATAVLTFAEGCASNSDTGFVLGNAVDAMQPQVINAQRGASENQGALPNVEAGGIGPKVGWQMGNEINLLSTSWVYNEPSYFPAQLLSSDMVSGPTTYNDLAVSDGSNAAALAAASIGAGLSNFFGQEGVVPKPPVQ